MPVEKKCENCQGVFASYPSDNRHFCSLACRSAFRFGKLGISPGREVVHFSCKECGTQFSMMRAYLTAYRKKHPQDPMYCSRTCAGAGRKRETNARNTFTCIACGTLCEKARKPGGRLYREQKYCSRECRHEMIKKRAFARFNSGDVGRHIKRHGYVYLAVPALASSTGKKTAVLEHRYIMEQRLGRPLLKEETVHHINGNRQDNRIENLELFSSRHGPGQRVTDKVAFAVEILRQYPEFARQAGIELRDVSHVTESS